MGLDQYASTVDANNNTTELATWRKHPNLQGWMEGLYRARGGEDEFNCVDLELTLADLDMLEGAVKSSDLPSTAGFFFGGDKNNITLTYEDLGEVGNVGYLGNNFAGIIAPYETKNYLVTNASGTRKIESTESSSKREFSYLFFKYTGFPHL